MEQLTLTHLKKESKRFCEQLQQRRIPELYGITDGKAVGTYVEHSFKNHLGTQYRFTAGSSAYGIDFPDEGLQVDLKVTSIRQPQSSCPYQDASQKVYGLGYNLLLMIYHKEDFQDSKETQLRIESLIFINKERTADYQTTYGLSEILRRDGNVEDVVAFLEERNLPLDEVGRQLLAQRILATPPVIGYLTISNALQWRLQYSRAIQYTDQISGLENWGG
ncbi:MAG: restriction endonuclease [Phototrophicaceae bacterium]